MLVIIISLQVIPQNNYVAVIDNTYEDYYRNHEGLDVFNPIIKEFQHSEFPILYIYDPTTGYPIYKDSFVEHFSRFFLIDVIRLDTFMTLDNNSLDSYLAIVVDPSVGGLHGSDITLTEAKKILNTYKPLLLFGPAHGVIDREVGLSYNIFSKTSGGYVSFEKPFMNHSIKKYPIPIEQSFQFLSDNNLEMEYYNSSFLSSQLIPIIYSCSNSSIKFMIYYERPHVIQKIIWLSVEDFNSLSEDGISLVTNTLFWLCAKSRISILVKSVLNNQILESTEYLGYGGFFFYSEGLVTNTFLYISICETLGISYNLDNLTLINFLIKNYNKSEGSFSDYDVITSEKSKAWVTGLSVYLLKKFNAINMINKTRTLLYLSSLQTESGGFKSDIGSSSINIENTYAAVLGISLLDDTFSTINKSAIINYIKNLQVLDGQSPSYGGFKYSTSSFFASIKNSYFAVATLLILNSLESVDVNALSIFINSLEKENGGFLDSPITTTHWSTGQAVWLLSKIGRLDSINNITRTRDFLLNSQMPDGGFGNNPNSTVSSLKWTFYAVLGLKELTYSPNNINSLIKYLQSTKAPTGGIGVSRYVGSVLDSYFSVEILNLTGSMHSLKNKTALINFLLESYIRERKTFFMTIYKPSIEGLPLPIKNRFVYIPSEGIIETFYVLRSLYLLSSLDAINQSMINNITSTIISSQCLDNSSVYYGMFSYEPTYLHNDLRTRFEFTIFSILTLSMLDSLGGINLKAVREYLNQTYSYTNNSYPAPLYLLRFPPNYEREHKLYSTYISLLALKELGALNSTILNAAYNIAVLERNDSNIANVFLRIEILEFLQSYNSSIDVDSHFNKTLILQTLLSLQRKDGLFKANIPADYWIEESSFALKIVKKLRLTPFFDEALSLKVDALQIEPSEHEWRLGEQISITLTLYEGVFNEIVTSGSVSLRIKDYEVFLCQTQNGTYSTILTPNSTELLGHQSIEIYATNGTLIPSIVRWNTTITTQLNLTIISNGYNFTTRDTLRLKANVTSVTNYFIQDAYVLMVLNDTLYPFESLGNGTYVLSKQLSELSGYHNITIVASREYCSNVTLQFQIFVFNSTTATKITISKSIITWNESINISIFVNNEMGLPNGSATIILDGQILSNVTIENGSGEYQLFIPPNFSLGNHTLHVIFNYFNITPQYLSSSDLAQFYVYLRPDGLLNLSNASILTKECVIINASIFWENQAITTNFTLSIYDINRDELVYSGLYYNNSISIKWIPQTYGVYNISLIIHGNSTIVGSTAWKLLYVNKQSTNIFITDIPEEKYYHENVTFYIWITDEYNSTLNDLRVIIYINDTLLDIVDTPTMMFLPFDNLPLGYINLTIKYLGNDTFEQSILKVTFKNKPSPVELQVSNLLDGTSVTTNVTITSIYEIPNWLNFSIRITDPANKTILSLKHQISNNIITWNVNLSGYYRIYITFDGQLAGFESTEKAFILYWDKTYLYEPVDLTIEIKGDTPIHVYDTIEINISLSRKVQYLNANLTIIYASEGKIISRYTLPSGHLSITMNWTFTKVGEYILSLEWYNITEYVSKNVSVIVKPISANIWVDISNSTSYPNVPLILTIHVNSTVPVNGSLLIFVNQSIIKNIELLAYQGNLNITLSNLSPGTYQITIHFKSSVFENKTIEEKVRIIKIPTRLLISKLTHETLLGNNVTIVVQLINDIDDTPILGVNVYLLVYWPISGTEEIIGVTNETGYVHFTFIALEEGSIPFSVEFHGNNIFKGSTVFRYINVQKEKPHEAPNNNQSIILTDSYVIVGFAIIGASTIPIIYAYRRVSLQVKRIFKVRKR